MKHLFTLLLLCSTLFVHAQFRMVGNVSGSWTTVNDSTYTGAINFQSDLTGQGYLATAIADTFKLFTPTEQLYKVDSVWNQTFSGASVRLIRTNGAGSPVGQLLVFNPDGRQTIPNAPFGSTGATAQLNAAVDAWNARQGIIVDGSETIIESTDGDILVEGSGTESDPYRLYRDFSIPSLPEGILLQSGLNWESVGLLSSHSAVAFGENMFVAVTGNTASGNVFAYSYDGKKINYTAAPGSNGKAWSDVCYGKGLFVAVAASGTGNRACYSHDGINWYFGNTPANNAWSGVTYGNGRFVAVSNSGTGNRVMTSEDGINWTIRTSAADNFWTSIAYGNGIFAAVAANGTGNRVMTSVDGITWTIRTSAADNQWRSIVYGNGLFVAVSDNGTGNRVMTSEDGINWTIRTSAANRSWYSVAYGNGLFVAASQNFSTADAIMTSSNGIDWVPRSTNSLNTNLSDIAYGKGVFFAVSGGVGLNSIVSGKIESMGQAEHGDGIYTGSNIIPAGTYARAAGLFRIEGETTGSTTGRRSVMQVAKSTIIPAGVWQEDTTDVTIWAGIKTNLDGATRVRAGTAGLNIETADVVNTTVLEGSVLQTQATNGESEFTPYALRQDALPDNTNRYNQTWVAGSPTWNQRRYISRTATQTDSLILSDVSSTLAVGFSNIGISGPWSTGTSTANIDSTGEYLVHFTGYVQIINGTADTDYIRAFVSADGVTMAASNCLVTKTSSNAAAYYPVSGQAIVSFTAPAPGSPVGIGFRGGADGLQVIPVRLTYTIEKL